MGDSLSYLDNLLVCIDREVASYEDLPNPDIPKDIY